MSDEEEPFDLRKPEENQVFAVVTEHSGGNHVRLQCADGKERMGRIPGRMKFRTWIDEGDVVLVEPWDWQDEKATIEHRYEKPAADRLWEEGYIE